MTGYNVPTSHYRALITRDRLLEKFGVRYARCSYCGREHSPTPKGRCKGCAAQLHPLFGYYLGMPVYIVDPTKAADLMRVLA